MLNLNKYTEKLILNLNQQASLRTTHVSVSLYTTVVHNTKQNSSDNFSSYPPDSHHSSDNIKHRMFCLWVV